MEPYTTIKQIADHVKCGKKGSCGVFASWVSRVLLKRGFDDFVIVFGWVKDGNVTHDHIWIELGNGEIIDPTCEQFGTVERLKKRRTFVPHKFLNMKGFRVSEKLTKSWYKEYLAVPKSI